VLSQALGTVGLFSDKIRSFRKGYGRKKKQMPFFPPFYFLLPPEAREEPG